MSYGAAMALQAAVYQRLRDDPAVIGLVGDAIFDVMPVEVPGGTFVSLGPEEVRDAGDMTAKGSRHDFVVSILSGRDEAGFRIVKEAANAVAEALERTPLTLETGHLAGLWFLRAKARRVEKGAGRRVDLSFRARIDLE